METLKKLKDANGINDVALILGYKPSALAYILYKLSDAEKYKEFKIPKRAGGFRVIHAPCKELKAVQRKLALVLYSAVDEIRSNSAGKYVMSHGFEKGRGILTNAVRHRAKHHVFNVDLKDFFPSIHFGRVRGYFIRDRGFELKPTVATILAKIACRDGVLPQGSPSSPIISNLIGHLLDVKLVGLAKNNGCIYTRYADDITFSTNKKTFPLSVAHSNSELHHVWEPSSILQSLVKNSGFEINQKKTRMQYCDSRQEVTGLIVNRCVNSRVEYRKSVRAMVDSLLKNGSFHLFESLKNEAGEVSLVKVDGSVNRLHGMLAFIDQVYYSESKRVAGKVASRLHPSAEIFRLFLLYKNLHASDLPVIVCEGETDNVYLSCAIHQLWSKFPLLAGVGADGKVKLNIRILKYSKTQAGRILGMNDGGSMLLSNLVDQYFAAIDNSKGKAKIKSQGTNQPILIVFDNDSGAINLHPKLARHIDDTAKKINLPYSHIKKNVYGVPTPPLPGKNATAMEDFFTKETLGYELFGKTFNPSKDKDVTKHYDKVVFAHKVIKPNAANIDFSGFIPILNSMESAIKEHSAKLKV